VPPHPFDEMDVVDAVEKADRGALARKLSRLLNGAVGFHNYRRIVRRFGPDARTRHDQHNIQAVAARNHRFQHPAAGEFHATAIGCFNGNRRLRHWRPGDVESLLLEPALVAAHKKPRVIGDRSHHDAYRRQPLLRKGRCPADGERKCGGARYETPSSLAHRTLLSFSQNQHPAGSFFAAALRPLVAMPTEPVLRKPKRRHDTTMRLAKSVTSCISCSNIRSAEHREILFDLENARRDDAWANTSFRPAFHMQCQPFTDLGRPLRARTAGFRDSRTSRFAQE